MKAGKIKNEKVIFRQFKIGCEIIALFPEIACDNLGYNCESYMHVGQHGAASPDIVRDTKPVRDKDYTNLFNELTEIGYNLEIIKRFRYKHQKIRMASFPAF